MKKILIVMIAILMIIPASVTAETDPETFCPGIWITVLPLAKHPGETFTYLHLTKDHKAYFTVQQLEDDGTTFGRSAVKTWSVNGNRIHVVIGENTSMDLKIKDDFYLQDVDRPTDVYVRVPVATGW